MVAFNKKVETGYGYKSYVGPNETLDTVLWTENDTYNFLLTKYEPGESEDLKPQHAESAASSKPSSWFPSWALPGSKKATCKQLNADASETSPDTIDSSELTTRISRLETDARSYFTTLSPTRYSKSSNNRSGRSDHITWSRRDDTARHSMYKSLGGTLADPSVSQSRDAPSCTSTPSGTATVETYVSHYPITVESKAYLDDTVRLLRGRVRKLAIEGGEKAVGTTNTSRKPRGTLKRFDSTTIQVDRQTYDKSELSQAGTPDQTSFSPSCSQVCGGLLATALTGAALYGVYKSYHRV